MKKLFLLSVILFSALLTQAQTQGFNYKALITDNGSALANHQVTIRFTILENGSTEVYSETQTATTDENGIVSVVLGEGTAETGDFNDIKWGDNPHSLKVEIDTGNGYLDFGTNELKSVPYAKFAARADSIDYSHVSNTPVTFYLADTKDTPPFDINNKIYHKGLVIVGDSADPFPNMTRKLFVYNKNSKDGGNTHIEVSTASIEDRNCYGSYNYLRSDISDSIYGSFSFLYALASGSKRVGFATKLDGRGMGEDYGLLNNITTDTPDKQYGVYNNINNTNIAYNYGVYNNINGKGSGNHYGNYTLLSGEGTGEQYGTYNFISNTNDGDQFGTYNAMSGSGSGKHYGVYNKFWGGTGEHYGVYSEFLLEFNNPQYGFYSNMHSSGSGTLYGTYNNINGTGSGYQYGVYNTLQGSSDGIQEGTHNEILTNNDRYHFGTYNIIKNDGNGGHYGVYNDLSGKGNGKQFALYNAIKSSGTGNNYGVYNWLAGNGSGSIYGINNTIDGSKDNYIIGVINNIGNTGNGKQYGVYNNITNDGSGEHYGSYNRIEGNGTGDKYGVYSYIPSSSGGTHIAIYGHATGTGNLAGMFLGDIEISGKIKLSNTGDANMTAYVYGFVLYNGNLLTDRSTNGFTVNKTDTGVYEIKLLFLSTDDDEYIVNVSTEYSNSPVISNVDYAHFGGSTDANVFYVRTFDMSGTPVDNSFHFVVYKK